MGFGDWIKGLFGGGGDSDDSGRCMACEAPDLMELAPDAYRCAACGYEGGDGYAAFLADKERVALRDLDADALRAKVVAGLSDARLILVGAIGGEMSGNTGWEFSVSLGDGDSMGGLSQANEEERERIRMEREAGIAQAQAAVVALRPTIDVLGEKGVDVAEHQQRLETIATQDPAPLEALKTFIVNAGKRLGS